MNQQKLNEVVRLHKLWLDRNPKGERANLQGVNLEGANLLGANLKGANLRRVNLQRANLERADLRGANLWRANLWEADLWGANLQGTYLNDANLRGTYLYSAKIYEFQKVPAEGSFRAWKKLCVENVHSAPTYKVIEVEIPAEAKRTSVLTSNKCRAEAVKVITRDVDIKHRCYHDFSVKIIYKTGEIVEAHKWDDDIRDPCLPGIHFFMTRSEAENFNI